MKVLCRPGGTVRRQASLKGGLFREEVKIDEGGADELDKGLGDFLLSKFILAVAVYTCGYPQAHSGEVAWGSKESDCVKNWVGCHVERQQWAASRGSPRRFFCWRGLMKNLLNGTEVKSSGSPSRGLG